MSDTMIIPPEIMEWQREDMIDEILADYEVEGIEDIIHELDLVKSNGSYEKMANNFGIVNKRRNYIMGCFLPSFARKENSLIKMASENMKNPIIPRPFGDTFCYGEYCLLYLYLEVIYSMYSERKLNYGDLRNIYLSGLDFRLVFALENFECVLQTPEPTPDFFQRLRKMHFVDKQSEKLFIKISMLKRATLHNVLGYFFFSSFQLSEMILLTVLAGCSAAGDNRDKVNAYDGVRANLAYLKLIRTDITQYKAPGIPKTEVYDDLNGENQSAGLEKEKGYLLCEQCLGVYHLEPGESPEDFETCRCGGKLMYFENFFELENELLHQKIDI